jgi:dihydroflavonol-4-reductase
VRVVVTGGAGFVGRSLVRRLLTRGDEVIALVRDPRDERTAKLAGPSVELVGSDLRDPATLTAVMTGTDAVVHAAGSYRVGIPASERPAMYELNVAASERVLDAAIAAQVPRIVHVSTVNAFGNTKGRIVDETFRRDPSLGYVSYYDETKWLAHHAAELRAADGAPVMIVQPSQVYGRGDHSAIGAQLAAAYAGTLPFIGLGGIGIGFVHVDDLTAGIVAVLERGQVGRAYILGGPAIRLRDALATAARAGGKRLPRLVIPDLPLRIGATLLPNAGGLFGLSPNLREIVSASIGVTYWASPARAAAELGFTTRPLEEGLADTYGGTASGRSG